MLIKLNWTIGGRRLESFAVLACISELGDYTDHSLPQIASLVINFLQPLFLGWLGGNAMSITSGSLSRWSPGSHLTNHRCPGQILAENIDLHIVSCGMLDTYSQPT